MPLHPVLHSFDYAIGYVCEQVADVPDAQMVAQPAGIPNHPAWNLGHLTFACQLLGGTLGLPAWLPDDWPTRYGPGSTPAADPALYQSKADGLAILRDARSRITCAVAELDDAQLDAEFPDPSYREVFPTLRHAITQVLVGHPAYHIGQLTVWRKAMGFPRMNRSFE